MSEAPSFDLLFTTATGNKPFPWQHRLYDRFVSERRDNIPASCDVPTGLGKTSVVAAWLIALATHPKKMPRRLVYVVNRRTVVDQTTVEVEKLRARLASPEEQGFSRRNTVADFHFARLISGSSMESAVSVHLNRWTRSGSRLRYDASVSQFNTLQTALSFCVN